VGSLATSSRSTVEVIPSARRLVNSLRDLGYDFVHAIADLVDNSVAAEAMRFGAERDYEVDDLGKFGLGLKTASLSQCRTLTVASRCDASQRRIEVRRWDLDRVEKSNKWEIEILGSDEKSETLLQPLEENTGTVVLWESLERVLKYKVAWGENAKNGLYRLAEQLDQHLGMVFHRFLNGEARRKKKLAITVNGTPIEPWDPFARGEKHTESFPAQEFEVPSPHGRGTVRYQPFVLPTKDKFSNVRAFEKMSGPEKWNRQQGFYIYRADRMIQSGGWCRMRTADEHTKLARSAIDFFPDLDSAFEINIAKFRVTLPLELRERLEAPVERLVRRARTVYNGEKSFGSTSGSRHSRGIETVNSRAPKSTPRNGTTATLSKRIELSEALALAAKDAGEAAALKKILRSLAKRFPELAHEFGF
jgi:hypothetical protein